ncbi:MAG TPA: hypothetical protein VFY23_05155 [Candidatus Limnocylindrales bacterium]|nr:hypothetical protein [Candidatus Limnocylindrales bacterium]
MKRLAIGITTLATLAVVTAAPVAARPGYGCPAEASGFVRVDRDGWWDRSVAGWAEAGIAVYDGADYSAEFDAWAAAMGLVDGAGVEAYVRGAQWDAMDKNTNDWLCMRDQPNTPGSPGYIFVGVDDSAVD